MVNKKSTIKNDPFALVIPEPAQDEEAAAPASPAMPAGGIEAARRGEGKPRPSAARKEKLTVLLTHDIIERVKNAAYWNPRLTIAAIAERGIAHVIEEIEREHGGPYPPREEELKGGRPIGSTSSSKPGNHS
jgi:hypothetical protein